MIENTMNMGTYFGAQTSGYDMIIPDRGLRKALIDASIKMEGMLQTGQITLDRRIVSKTEWGLEIEIEMARPKEDKPIIFSYTYKINRVTFKQWLDNHSYLLGGPLLMFTDRGMDFIVTTDKFQKTMASIVIRETDGRSADINKYEHPIVETPLTLVVHREVVNNHDWIVKCAVS